MMKRVSQYLDPVIASVGAAAALIVATQATALWSRLPSNVVIHVDEMGHANGWMARAEFVLAAIGLLLLDSAFLARMLRNAARPLRGMVAGMVAFEAATIAAVLALNATANAAYLQVITGLAIAIGALAIGGAGVALAADGQPRHGAMPDDAHVVASFHHGSRRQTKIGVAFLILPLAVVIGMPDLGARLLAAGGLLVGFWAVALVAHGFDYIVTDRGVAVCWFPRRAQWIELGEIVSSAPRSVSPVRDLGGWGIRGTGSERAFLLRGHTGVQITMRTGAVFLAHDPPEELIHALVTAGAATERG